MNHEQSKLKAKMVDKNWSYLSLFLRLSETYDRVEIESMATEQRNRGTLV